MVYILQHTLLSLQYKKNNMIKIIQNVCIQLQLTKENILPPDVKNYSRLPNSLESYGVGGGNNFGIPLWVGSFSVI